MFLGAGFRCGIGKVLAESEHLVSKSKELSKTNSSCPKGTGTLWSSLLSAKLGTT